MLSESFAPKKRFFNTVIIIAACLGHADFDLVQDKFSVRIITIQVAQNSKNGLLAKVRVHRFKSNNFHSTFKKSKYGAGVLVVRFVF